MTDIELLPCPFCGGKASMMHSYPCWVECVSCGADTPDSAPVDEDGAAAAWNTLANVAHATAAKDAEIEQLRAVPDDRPRTKDELIAGLGGPAYFSPEQEK